MTNPFKVVSMKEDQINMSGSPVYDATLKEMGNMHELLRSLYSTVVGFGAVVVRPTHALEGPFDLSNLDATVECCKQRVPHTKFVLETKFLQGSEAAP